MLEKIFKFAYKYYDIYLLDGFGCPNNSYVCKNRNCIADDLKCDGEDHCGDNSDETYGCIGNKNIIDFCYDLSL